MAYKPKKNIRKGSKLRNQFGFSQEDIALIMQVSRSAVNLRERGEHAIGWKKSGKDIDLAKALLTQGPLPYEFVSRDRINRFAKDDIKKLRKELTHIPYELELLRRKLEASRIEYVWIEETMSNLERLLYLIREDKDSTLYLLATIRYDEMQAKAAGCGELMQNMLEMKIAVLEVRKIYIENILSKIPE
jgi:transcriptional regulator with XRE-family HTH domain